MKLALLGVSLCAALASAQAPAPLLELQRPDTRVPLHTGPFFTLGSQVIFGTQRLGRLELWSTDTTTAGTHPFFRVEGQASNFGVVGPWLFFLINTGNSLSAWRTDGTTAGTVRMLEGGWVNAPRGTRLGTSVVFEASNSLWRVEDAAPTPVKVFDVPAQREFLGIAAAGPLACFTLAGIGVDGELWCTDGTTAGTHAVAKPTTTLPSPLQVDAPLAGSRKVFVRASQRLLVVDSGGTTSSVVADGVVQGVSFMTPWAGGLVFVAYDVPMTGLFLWFTDGTTAGTRKVGALDGPRVVFGAGPSTLWLMASAGMSTWSVFRTDATASTLQTVATGVVGLNDDLHASSKGLFVRCEPAMAAPAMCFTDGNAAPVQVVKDFPFPFAAVLGDQLVFGPGHLNATDGTVSGTRRVRVMSDYRLGIFPPSMTAHGLVFGPVTPDAGPSLVVSDGTAAGSVLLPLKARPFSLPTAGEACLQPLGLDQAWITDGTAATTRALPAPRVIEVHCVGAALMLATQVTLDGELQLTRVQDDGGLTVLPCAAPVGPTRIARGGALVTFTAGELMDGGSGSCTIGVDGGIQRAPAAIAALAVGSQWLLAGHAGLELFAPGEGRLTSLSPEDFAFAQLLRPRPDRALVIGLAADGGVLMATDGTAAGTRTVARWATNAVDGRLGRGEVVAEVGHTDAGEPILLRTDGVTEHQVVLPERWARPAMLDGTLLLLSVRFPDDGGLPTGSVAYRWDLDAGLVKLADPPMGLTLTNAFAGAKALYMNGFDDDAGAELWSISGDGTAARLTDLEPGPESSEPAVAGQLGGTLVFVASRDGADQLYGLSVPERAADVDLSSVELAPSTPAPAQSPKPCGCSAPGAALAWLVFAWRGRQVRSRRPARNRQSWC